MPLYEYINETVPELGLVPATHIPRPVSSCPYVIEPISPAAAMRERDPRMGCQFNPSVEYTIFAVVSMALLAVDADPPATNNPFPNAHALHLNNIVSEFGTSLQLIPS
jgi:hypothetical protein